MTKEHERFVNWLDAPDLEDVVRPNFENGYRDAARWALRSTLVDVMWHNRGAPAEDVLIEMTEELRKLELQTRHACVVISKVRANVMAETLRRWGQDEQDDEPRNRLKVVYENSPDDVIA